MTQVLMRRELQPLVQPAGHRVKAAAPASYRLPAISKDADLRAVIVFAVIGLLMSICLTMLLPLSAKTAVIFAQLS